MSVRIENQQVADLLKTRGAQGVTPAPTTPPVAPADSEFGQIFQNELKISGHAQTRLASRNIQMGQAEWDRVMGGVRRAAEKGSKESLVMMDDVALVVSVKNKTVITAVDKQHLKDNVFTNIDSAVIV